MRRLAAALAALLVLLAGSASAEARHSVLYFYRSYCEACTPEEDFAVSFRGVTGLSLDQCDFTAWNVVRQDGQDALAEAVRTYALDADPALPLAIVDGVAYAGAAQMNAQLAAEALSWHTTQDSEVLLLYVPACESCAEVEAALKALPERVPLKRGEIEVESRVVVRRVDASASPAYAQALFEAYGVPDDERVTPIAFFADRYLSGAAAITERLGDAVALGWAAGGVPEVDGGEAVAPASLLQTVLTGLTAGLNTCALSMLLLFLSLVLQSGKRALGPALCYLLAKLACYLLIGFALLGVMQRLNPHWLRPLARWLLTAMGAALIALNISDAVHARRGDLGNIKNQLPGGLRGGLRRLITRLADSRALIPAAAVLGFLVAGGEFLCAGQLYLMQLMNAAQSGVSGQRWLLVAYCLAFLAPSAAVTAAVILSGSQLRAARFFSDHMALIKLLTAAAMLALIVTAWLL